MVPSVGDSVIVAWCHWFRQPHGFNSAASKGPPARKPQPPSVSPQGSSSAEGAIPVLEDGMELTSPGALHYKTGTGFFDATKAFNFIVSGTYDIVGDAVNCEGGGVHLPVGAVPRNYSMGLAGPSMPSCCCS